MTTKTCRKCKAVKPTNEFNIDRITKDGLCCYCRTCTKKKALLYISRPDVAKRCTEAAREYYKKNKERVYANVLKYRRTPKGKEMAAAVYAKWARSQKGRVWFKAYRQARPELAKAHDAVRVAIRNGLLHRPPNCQKCQCVAPVEAHHHKGYQKKHWLNVQWLCASCHAHTR